ncbi:MAG: DinB family protein [Proteobacteria bacterium]|nr:DinB family protein [Actinomycetes bacterium]NHZ70100.1 DinB family protein [Pseudomonadota bacterium]
MDGLDLVRAQLDLTLRFAEDALNALTAHEELWVPSIDSWTVREIDGVWVPDWAEPEPLLPPTTSIAWIQWHAIWWWSTVINRSFGDGSLQRQDVMWPGPTRSMALLDDLREEWLGHLDHLSNEDLGSGTLTRWPYSDGRPFLFVVGWVNTELMKNLSEIALLRRMVPGPDESS